MVSKERGSGTLKRREGVLPQVMGSDLVPPPKVQGKKGGRVQACKAAPQGAPLSAAPPSRRRVWLRLQHIKADKSNDIQSGSGTLDLNGKANKEVIL